ncbi:MAG TPA: class E sortase [Candidatus Saccharimonadales bacterium]
MDGESPRILQKGIWHRPASAAPNKPGNVVLAGHRFTYQNPQGVFYHLDKLKTSDQIGLVWQGKVYRYKVREIKVVGANETPIEAPTNNARLTLYTCTPLWLPKDRLVIIAEPEVSL